jgi:uridylate kinase
MTTTVTASLPYQRVLLKVGGESLGGATGSFFDKERCCYFTDQLSGLLETGTQLAIVLGAGNLCRGEAFASAGFDRVSADKVGMLSTLLNALVLKEHMIQLGMDVALMSALPVPGIAARYDSDKAKCLLAKGKVLLLAGGTGNPLVTTDTAAALRAVELQADILLKGTKVKGVYSTDPKVNTDAVFYPTLSYQKVLEQQLKVMDLSAMTLCREQGMPIHVFDFYTPGSLQKVVLGESVGTMIVEEEL